MGVNIFNKVKSTIERYRMLDRGDRICVAVSGGPDSVALLRLLSLLASDYNLYLVVAHLNHGLRGNESNRDEAFVQELGRLMEVPVKSKYVPVNSIKREKGGSLEDICRKARFKFLKEVLKEEGLNKIALGHNLNDQAETIMMRFLRGSGMTGIKGMLPVRDNMYIRPLLEVTRKEILAFLKSECTGYVTDSSNSENMCLRNRIRNDLIPELQDHYNARLVENLGRMADVLRGEDDFIEGAVDGILTDWKIPVDGDTVKIKISEFKGLHCALQRRVIKLLLERISLKRKGIGYLHIAAVMDLINGERPNGFLDLPFQIRIEREYDNVFISKEKNHTTVGATPFCYPVEIPGVINIREAGIKIKFDIADTDDCDLNADKAVFMDYDAIKCPLEIRNMRPGDRIHPIGMDGTKKIKEYFIDKKISKKRRGRIPLLVDRESVLWIMGMRLSNRVRLTDMTEKVVKAEII